jgi:hypothetical protein
MFNRLAEVLSITFVVLQSMYIKQVIRTQISYTKQVVKTTCIEITYIVMTSIMLRIKSKHAFVFIPTSSTQILQPKYL